MKHTKEIEARESGSEGQLAGFGKRKAPMVIEPYAGRGTLGIKTYKVFSRGELLALAAKAGKYEADCLILDSHAILSGYESADGSLQVNSGYMVAAVKGGVQ